MQMHRQYMKQQQQHRYSVGSTCFHLTAASLSFLDLHGLVHSLGQVYPTLFTDLHILGAGLELHPDWLEGHVEASILASTAQTWVSNPCIPMLLNFCALFY